MRIVTAGAEAITAYCGRAPARRGTARGRGGVVVGLYYAAAGVRRSTHPACRVVPAGHRRDGRELRAMSMSRSIRATTPEAPGHPAQSMVRAVDVREVTGAREGDPAAGAAHARLLARRRPRARCRRRSSRGCGRFGRERCRASGVALNLRDGEFRRRSAAR